VFLKPNNFSKRVIFLEEGLYRTFYYQESKDITQHFWDKNSFNTPMESTLYDKEAPYGWQAIEVCKVRYIEYKDFQKIIMSNKDFSDLILEYISGLTKIFSDRAYALNFRTAEERYEYMKKTYPHIIHRTPLGYLASYMGITQQTLSILRAKK
jgi:CRP-like cAMP-binding protein